MRPGHYLGLREWTRNDRALGNNNLQSGALSSVGSERLPYNPLRRDVNHGKKSSKSNWDCTICRSCRKIVIGPFVLEQRENRVE